MHSILCVKGAAAVHVDYCGAETGSLAKICEWDFSFCDTLLFRQITARMSASSFVPQFMPILG